MTQRVMGFFESQAEADGAVSELIRHGFARDSIHIGRGVELTRGTEHKEGGLRGFLKDIGLLPQEPAAPYSGNIRDEDVMVAVDADDALADEAADCLHDSGAIDIDQRGAATTMAGEGPGIGESGRAISPEKETSVPVIEEQLKAGKREVRHGGVRIFTRRTERPVEEEMKLREEKVYVERHAVDRPASPGDLAAFKEGSMELTETSEEPVVSKQARVKEEVVIGKEVGERTERIHETLYGTEVEVEQLTPEEEAEFSALEPDLRGTEPGRPYDELRPMYRYGYHMGHTPRYQRDEWSSVEPDLRQDWESHHQAQPWEQYKSAIRTGWERAVHPH